MTRRKRRLGPDRPHVIVNGQRLSAGQERLWRVASDEVDSGDPAKRRRGVAALLALEAEIAAAQASSALNNGINETAALERARGEKVEISGQGRSAGRVRIQTRDGLETLRRTGAIDARQHRAGLAYRDLYEAADPERDLKSQMGDLDRRGGQPMAAGRPEAWAERRIRLMTALVAIEAKIRTAQRHGHGVRALREVAGHARCISHFVQGGGAQTQYRRALVIALDLCADHFKLR